MKSSCVLVIDISDSSGYVYDLSTNERLQGVTTTCYWIENDGSDTFQCKSNGWMSPLIGLHVDNASGIRPAMWITY